MYIYSNSANSLEPQLNDQDLLSSNLKLFRCRYIQTLLYNHIFSRHFNRPYLLCLVLGFNVTAYCTVRESASFDLAVYVVFPFCTAVIGFLLIVLSNIMASVYHKSVDALGSMFPNTYPQDAHQRKLHRLAIMELRALRPSQLWIGSLYFMKKSTKLALIGFLINSTLYLLLTF